MKAVVVYDTAFGNTEKIALAIGQALEQEEAVNILKAGSAQPENLTSAELLIVGSPTQKFRPLPSVTALLQNIPPDGLKKVRVAAFDTRITPEEVARVGILAFLVKLFGYAAEAIGKKLSQKGGTLLVPPQGFYVQGTQGPLVEGELERAAAWAKKIAEKIE